LQITKTNFEKVTNGIALNQIKRNVRNQTKQFWADGSLGWNGYQNPHRTPCKSQMTSEHIVA